MQKAWKLALVSSLAVLPILAGALVLQIGNPAGNPEARAKNAAIVARITSCHSPEKTIVTATATGSVDGRQQSMPLKVISLSTPGTYAVTHEWPEQGAWVIKFEATNPDYKNYATGA
ncbi:MAG TPA: hypothetical protein VHV08_12415, partial [Pirellulales bacterium]|nr:hypothetical protein [Pirellulales bacterium]